MGTFAHAPRVIYCYFFKCHQDSSSSGVCRSPARVNDDPASWRAAIPSDDGEIRLLSLVSAALYEIRRCRDPGHNLLKTRGCSEVRDVTKARWSRRSGGRVLFLLFSGIHAGASQRYAMIPRDGFLSADRDGSRGYPARHTRFYFSYPLSSCDIAHDVLLSLGSSD